MCDEIPLKGGRMTQGVVRKGDYVFRPCCPNSSFVHDVLKWLEKKEVLASPRFVGLANDGREITTFLEGISPENLRTFNGDPQWQPTYNQFNEAGKIIKTLHVALSDFPGCQHGQTVCHNDLSPCNFMFMNDLPYAVFDWDASGVGDPLNDVAYASWMWSDIGDPDRSPVIKGREIKIILDAYELCTEQRNQLIDKMHEQIQRVSKSLLANNQLQASQWATDVDNWLYKYQNEIARYYT